jgi:HEAT repeat protein
VSEPDLAGAVQILAQIGGEQRRRQLADLLNELGRLPTIPDCTVLLPLVRHRWWQVRHEAISALGKCWDDPRAEAALIGVLAETADDDDRMYANAALSECGTAASIPALAAQIHHPTADVKCSAINALTELGDVSTLPVFLDALTDRSPAAKWYAMTAIGRHGTEAAIGPVCARVRVILARRRKRSQRPTSELLEALEYLVRYRDDGRAQETLRWVTTRTGYLDDREARWVAGHLIDNAH